MEKNELIAEFMGYKYYPHPNIDSGWRKEKGHLMIDKYFLCRKEKQMQYHTSWDWLMPVVEKIEGLGYWVTMVPYQCQIYKAEGNFYGDMIIDADFKDNRLDNTYDAVIGFIEWHNSQKS